MPRFLILAHSKQDSHLLGPSIANIKNAIKILDLFSLENFTPPKVIYITDNSCGSTAELLRENFIDVFGGNLIIPTIPRTEISQETLITRIVNASYDLVIAATNHPLEEILHGIGKRIVLPRKVSGIYFCDLDKYEILEKSIDEPEIMPDQEYSLIKF